MESTQEKAKRLIQLRKENPEQFKKEFGEIRSRVKKSIEIEEEKRKNAPRVDLEKLLGLKTKYEEEN